VVVVVVVVIGVIPGMGVDPGARVAIGAAVAPGAGGTAGFTAAGLIAVVGGRLTGGTLTGGALAGAGGGVWPNEVSAKVTEQRLAISSFFIGLIGKLSRTRFSMSLLSSMS
jgi:hypothetical protein